MNKIFHEINSLWSLQKIITLLFILSNLVFALLLLIFLNGVYAQTPTEPVVFVSNNTTGSIVEKFDINGNFLSDINAFTQGDGPTMATGDIDDDGEDELVVGKKMVEMK